MALAFERAQVLLVEPPIGHARHRRQRLQLVGSDLVGGEEVPTRAPATPTQVDPAPRPGLHHLLTRRRAFRAKHHPKCTTRTILAARVSPV